MTRPLPVLGAPIHLHKAVRGAAGNKATASPMTECHAMGGAWGELASSGDNGDQRYSLVSCNDCEHKFQMKTLGTLGAIPGHEAAFVHRFD